MRAYSASRIFLLSLFAIAVSCTTALYNPVFAQKSAEERARERSDREADRVRDNRDLPPDRRGRALGRSKPLSTADRRRLDDCVDRMLMGPTKKKIKIQGHQFNCKRHSRWNKSGDFYKVEGQLSHHLTARPDDQVNYSFLVSSSGEIGGLTMKTKKGGLRKIVDKFGGLGNTKVKIGTWYADKFLQATGQAVDGSWQGSSALIIGTMAIRIGRSVRLAKASKRGGASFYWFVDRPGNDIRNVTLQRGRDRPEFCQNLCGNTPNCRAWTLNKNALTRKSVCWMKGSIGDVVLNNRTVSGIKASRSRPGRGGATIGRSSSSSGEARRRGPSFEDRRVPGSRDPLDDRHGGMEEEDP